MIQFIADHRGDHGVEPICRLLPIAPANFQDHLAKRADPSRLSGAAKRALGERLCLCRDMSGFCVCGRRHSDVFARRIVGWRVSRTAIAGFVLGALEQAVHQRQPVSGLPHHFVRGSQDLSIGYTERLAEAGIEPPVGSIGDSYNNALAETINGLFKAEVIHRPGPWRSFDAGEYATLEWLNWFNNRRLLEPTGNIPPAEAEAN